MGKRLVKENNNTNKNKGNKRFNWVFILLFIVLTLVMAVIHFNVKNGVVYVDAKVHDLHNHGGTTGHGYVDYEYDGVEYKGIDIEVSSSVKDGDTIQIPIVKNEPSTISGVDMLITTDLIAYSIYTLNTIFIIINIYSLVDKKRKG